MVLIKATFFWTWDMGTFAIFTLAGSNFQQPSSRPVWSSFARPLTLS